MTRRNQAWTLNELDFIKKNYKKMTVKEMAEKLNRTKSSIYTKSTLLGVNKPKVQYAVYEYGELTAIGTMPELVKRLGRTEGTLRNYATPKGKIKKYRVEKWR